MSAAAMQARRQAVARAARPQIIHQETLPPAAAAASVGAAEGGGQAVATRPPQQEAITLLETDDALIKVMNELGPAIKTMRHETPRKDVNKMVRAQEEVPHTLPEETLAAILRARREEPASFDLEKVCRQHDLKPDALKEALEVLQVPRIVERQGQKYGYWEETRLK